LTSVGGKWSGRWESNPRLKLGKLGYYHYTTPAALPILVGFHRVGKSMGIAARADLGTVKNGNPGSGPELVAINPIGGSG
jgi:hypothetical protein